MTPTNELEVVRALGRIEGNLEGVKERFDAVDIKLKEIHDLGTRVTTLEARNNKLYGALTVIGIIWSTVIAVVIKVIYGK